MHVKPTGKCSYVRKLRRCNSGDRPGVHAAAEVRSDVHVADKLPLDCLPEQAVKFFNILPLINLFVRRAEVVVPVAFRGRQFGLTLLKADIRTGRQHLYAGEEGPVRENVLERKVLYQGLGIQTGGVVRVGQDGLNLGSEDNLTGLEGVIQRLDTIAITDKKESSPPAVPERKGKHTVEPLQGLWAPFDPCVQHHLRVGAGLELMSQGRQFDAEFLEVIDFTVVTDNVLPGLIGHGLAPGRGQVDNGQSAMPQPQRLIDIYSLTVRPAVGHGVSHPLKQNR